MLAMICIFSTLVQVGEEETTIYLDYFGAPPTSAANNEYSIEFCLENNASLANSPGKRWEREL